MANTYTLISSNTLTSSAASVTFSSIPSTYTDLVLRISARNTSTSGFVNMTFNNNTGTVYSTTQLDFVNGGSPRSLFDSNAANIQPIILTLSTYTADTFGSTEIYIPNYAGTTNKPVSGFGTKENNSTTVNQLGVTASLARITSAITSIELTMSSNNFAINSSFYLYGIKNS